MSGRIPLRWDEMARAAPHGQMVFLAEIVARTGVTDHWVSFPLGRGLQVAPRKHDQRAPFSGDQG